MRWIQASLVMCVLVVFGWGGVVHAETLYAKKPGVKVTADKSPMSKVVATLSMGDAVKVLKKDGRAYRVELVNKKTGWVFKFKLSAKKPSGGGSSGSLFAGLSGGSSISAREARSGGSIRGLKRTSDEYVKTKKIDPAHMKSVETMEQRIIPPKKLTRFKQRGKLGEFSGGGQ